MMDADQFRELSNRVTLLERELNQVKGDVSSVRGDVSNVKSDTGEMLDIVKGMKTGVKVIGGLGIAFKWLTGVIVSAAALWATFKSGGPGS